MRPYAIFILLLVSSEVCLAGDTAMAGSRTDTRMVSTVPSGSNHRGVGHEAAQPSPRDLSPERLMGAIQKYLEEEWSERIKNVSVAVLDPSEAVPIPAGAVELRVLPSASDEGLGRRVFHLAVTVDRKPWKTIQVIADVSATVDAIVPTRFLKPDEVIEAGDLKIAGVAAVRKRQRRLEQAAAPATRAKATKREPYRRAGCVRARCRARSHQCAPAATAAPKSLPQT